jgi:hypothetical protein
MGFFSSKQEERTTTGIFLEGPLCSRTDEQWQRKETSDGDPGGGGVPDDVSGGVKTLFHDEELSLEGEQEHLVSLVSSFVAKRRWREENLKRKVKECEMVLNIRQRRYIYPVKHHNATVMGIVSISVRPLAHVGLKIVHHTPII